MLKENEVINFMEELLQNPYKYNKQMLYGLVLFHDMSLSCDNVKINHNNNFTYAQRMQYGAFDNYKFLIEGEGINYWAHSECELSNNMIKKMGVFSKNMFDEIYENIKIITIDILMPLNIEFINNYGDYTYLKEKFMLEEYSKNYIIEKRFINELFIFSLNNIIKNAYDVFLSKNEETKYSNLINEINKNLNTVIHKKKDKLRPNKIIEKVMKQEISHIISFSKCPFDGIDMKHYEDYIKIFNIILNEINDFKQNDIIIIEPVITQIEDLKKSDENKDSKPVKKRKKPIPPALKIKVWNKYIGDEIGKSKCTCCNIMDIYQASFSCGHIISEFNGGENKIENLMPICNSCNSSMGVKNMNEYKKEFGY